MPHQTDFSTELKFTNTYRQYQKAHPVIREANCLKAQFPDVLTEILDKDLFAGRISYKAVGFSPQFGGFGYYSDEERLKQAIESGNIPLRQKEDVFDMMLFWRKETTTRKIEAAFDDRMKEVLCRDKYVPFPFQHEPEIATPLYRMAGIYINYEELMQLGIPGMSSKIQKNRISAEQNGTDPSLYIGMLEALELFRSICHFYENQALQQIDSAIVERQAELQLMADTLAHIANHPPETFRQAIQLAWLYSIVVGALEYGRMDVYLGDFYVHDLENGIITEQEALDMVLSIWHLINDLIVVVDGRVIIGGKGRPNEANADQFALLAMEASLQLKDVLPQLTLRFYEGMNPALMEKAVELIEAGTTFPLLYNDDVLIPSVSQGYQVSMAEAEQYVPFGCGEIVLNHRSFGIPSGSINLLKALEVTLHNGLDPITGKVSGLRTGELTSFETFDQFYEAYKKQLRYFIEILADHEELEYNILGADAPFLYMSMLYDDCIANGKGMFNGGLRYLGGTLETYGNVNTADSLVALKQLVFEQKRFAAGEILTVLQNNFRGYDAERRWMEKCPKFGNDDPIADAIMVDLHNYVCNTIREQKERTNLHSYLAVIINNSMNTTLGWWVGATPDGRKAGGAMANANAPTGGCDKSGVTAMINSMAKPATNIHAGSVQNMRFSRNLITNQRSKFDALLDTYFCQGGSQAMVTVINRGDLERALSEPDKYSDIIVRVGGFSARFVELAEDIQMEVLSRTTY